MKDMVFRINKDEYEIIKSIQKDNNNYLIYKGKNNELYASKYEIINNELVLNPIENDKEWDFIDNNVEV